MVDLTNSVNPLSWNVPIVDSHGNPTPEFQLKWEQQTRTNASIPDLTTAAAVSAVLDEIGATRGSLLSRGASQWGVLAIGGANTILKSTGTDPAWTSLSSLMDTLGSARGDVLFRGVAGWTVLIPGTAGNVLTTAGAGADPSWTTPASGGGGAASIQDDGTNLYVALSDTDGQLVLDSSGDPVFSKEVLPPNSLPLASSSAFGAVEVDGTTITALAGVISAKVARGAFRAHNSVAQAVTPGVANTLALDTVDFDAGGWFHTTGNRYTPQVAGYYMFITNATVTLADGDFAQAGIKVNNTTIINGPQIPTGAAGAYTAQAITLVHLNGSTDFVQAKLFPGSASSVSATDTYFAGFLIQPD